MALLIAACLIACGTHEKKAERSIPGVELNAPACRISGAAKVAGLQADVAVTPAGVYSIAFLDDAGDDLPAATASNVSLEVQGETVRFEINETGESWVGQGKPPRDAATPARLAFTSQGKLASADVPLTQVDLPLDLRFAPWTRMSAPRRPASVPPRHEAGFRDFPDPEEYPLDVKISPSEFHAGEKVQLVFTVENPATRKIVDHFEVVHDRLFHLFDSWAPICNISFTTIRNSTEGGDFRFDTSFPKPGMYRLLADFYPSGGTPQLAPKTIFVPGPPNASVLLADAKLSPDTALQHGKITDAGMVLYPPIESPGRPRVSCFACILATVSKSIWARGRTCWPRATHLIDLLHEHPMSADGGPQIEFDLIFPRARTYRIWVQFQRKGVVNTVAFNVPVR